MERGTRDGEQARWGWNIRTALTVLESNQRWPREMKGEVRTQLAAAFPCTAVLALARGSRTAPAYHEKLSVSFRFQEDPCVISQRGIHIRTGEQIRKPCFLGPE